MLCAILTIKCECGAEVAKDYFMARTSYDYPNYFWSWMCQFCGQIFKETQKPPIKLDAEQGYGGLTH